MIGLFLDDERNPEDVTWKCYPDGIEWYVVRSMNDFLFAISNFDFDIISFDHDIQDYNFIGKENTGYDCLKSLIDFCIKDDKDLPYCVFHTQNPVGFKNMVSYYNTFKRHMGE